MTAVAHPLHSPTSSALWKTAQAVGLLATIALLIGLIVQPTVALFILWNVLIPLVPVSLLLSPLIWRNVCPLATINMGLNRKAVTRTLSREAASKTGMVAVLLLVMLVPARRFLFNTDGLALAIVIVAVALLALILGAFFDAKAGFCNSICPVLPVERLYGQAPLLRTGNARCEPCSLCTSRGCIDVAPRKSISHTVGEAMAGRRWLSTGFGIFAAAFPGFVVGYYTTADVPLTGAVSVYLHIGLYAAISYLVVTVAVHLFRPASRSAFMVLGAVAVGLYYWFASEVVLTAFGVGGLWVMGTRAVALLVVGLWLAEGLPATRPRRSVPG